MESGQDHGLRRSRYPFLYFDVWRVLLMVLYKNKVSGWKMLKDRVQQQIRADVVGFPQTGSSAAHAAD
jgi:hypothetical protein